MWQLKQHLARLIKKSVRYSSQSLITTFCLIKLRFSDKLLYGKMSVGLINGKTHRMNASGIITCKEYCNCAYNNKMKQLNNTTVKHDYITEPSGWNILFLECNLIMIYLVYVCLLSYVWVGS